jgi:hypothetical protein
MLHEAIGDEARHHLAGVADVLSAAVAQREGERVGDVFGRGGFEVDGLGCPRMIAAMGEQRKNAARKKAPAFPEGGSGGPKNGRPMKGFCRFPPSEL